MEQKISTKLQKTFPTALIAALALLVAFTITKFDILGAGLWIGFLIFLFTFLGALENPLLGALLLALVLPFERIPSFELAGLTLKLNQVVTIGVLLGVIFGGYLRKIQFRFNLVDYLVLLFWVAGLLSLATTLVFNRSVLILSFLILMVVVYFLVRISIQSRKALEIVLKGIFWITLIALLFAIFQFGGDILGLPLEVTGIKPGYDKGTFGFPRVHSFLSEPLYFANFLYPAIFLGGAIWFSKKKAALSPLSWGLLSAACLLFLVLGVSRGAYIGLLVGGIAFLIFFFKKIFTPRFLTILILALILISGGVFLFLKFSESRALTEFIKHVKVEDYWKGESVRARLKAFKGALKAYQASPYLGVGLGVYGPFVDGFPAFVPKGGWKIVNNQYLETLAETGMVGLIGLLLLFGGLLLRTLWAYFKTQDPLYKNLLAGTFCFLLAMMVQYLTFSTIYIYQIWFYLALASALQELAIKEKSLQ